MNAKEAFWQQWAVAGKLGAVIRIVEAAWEAATKAEHDRQQAVIDRLMLEHCPKEMTVAQMEEWARHQQPAGDFPKVPNK